MCVHMGINLVPAELLNLLPFMDKLILGRKYSKASSCSDVCSHPIREEKKGQAFPPNLVM